MRAARSPLLWLGLGVAFGVAVYGLSGRAVPPATTATRTSPPSARVPAAPERPRVTAHALPVRDTSPVRPDRAAFDEMRALVDEQRIGDARVSAERFFAEYPSSPYGARVERLTGVHPHQPPPQ